MTTMEIGRHKEMDDHFGIHHDRPYYRTADVRQVAEQIEYMWKERLQETVAMYELLPVYYYLDAIRDNEEPVKLSPFAKYINVYLIWKTGNMPPKLNKLSEQLTGETYTENSPKMMRRAIIENLLSTYR